MLAGLSEGILEVANRGDQSTYPSCTRTSRIPFRSGASSSTIKARLAIVLTSVVEFDLRRRAGVGHRGTRGSRGVASADGLGGTMSDRGRGGVTRRTASNCFPFSAAGNRRSLAAAALLLRATARWRIPLGAIAYLIDERRDCSVSRLERHDA